MCGGPLGMGALRISASSQGRASGTREPPRAAPANTGSLAPSYITWVPMGQVGDSPDTQPPNPQPPHTSAPHPSRPRKRPAQTLEADFGLLARNLQTSLEAGPSKASWCEDRKLGVGLAARRSSPSHSVVSSAPHPPPGAVVPTADSAEAGETLPGGAHGPLVLQAVVHGELAGPGSGAWPCQSPPDPGPALHRTVRCSQT